MGVLQVGIGSNGLRSSHLGITSGGGDIPEEDGVDHRGEPTVWLTDGSAEGAPADPESAEPATEPAPGDPAEDADPRLADVTLPDNPADVTQPGNPADVTLPVSSAADVTLPVSPADVALPGNSHAAAGQDVPQAGQRASDAGPEGPGDGKYGTQAGADSAPGGDSGRKDGIRIPPYQPPAPPYPTQVPTAPPAGVAAKVAAPFAGLTKPKAKPEKPVLPAGPGNTGPGGDPRVADRAAPAARPALRPAPPTRRAQLVLSRIEPWSVMKFSFMVSLVGWVILFVAVAALYFVLSKLGVFHSIQSTITDVTSSKGSAGTDANGQWFSASRVLGYTMLLGAVNVVLITALATVGAVIYNLVTCMAGGIEVTLKETD